MSIAARNGVVSVLLQKREQLLDPIGRLPRLTMRDVCQQLERSLPQIEQLLAFLVELGALAVYGRDLGCAVLRERRGRLSFAPTSMVCTEASSHDLQSVFVHEDRAGDVRGLRRHRIGHAFKHDLGGRSDHHGHAHGEVFRKHFDRSEPRKLLAPPRFRNHVRRATGPLLIASQEMAMAASSSSPTLARTAM